MPRFLCALALALVPTFAFAQLPPQKALESLVVAPDLQVELFAHEPDLINPTSIDVDHLGRVWVCEAVNYRRVMFNRPILRPEGDRIVILEDTKGVGKADKATVFYQGKDLIAPIGIAVAPIANGKPGACRVYVCQSPDILLFEDLDGDGKADGPPKKFLTGFKGFDHDHGVHGINIGPDGKLYFTVGDAGVDGLKSSDGKGRVWKSNTTDCRAGTVWRCDMDGKNLELIAHNFRNNYECCVNSFGEIWLSDNDDDGLQQTRICYVMPGGNYGYNPRGKGESHWHEEQPGIVHKVLRTGFGSPTGICFYEGTLLPERFRGQLLHCDAGPREFRCFHIKPKGAGYELEKELLVTSKDSWFRLSDVCVGPDGSVFLADWYDPGVGGHGMGDWTRGRIYRVTPKGHVGYKVPKVDVGTKDGMLEALYSPCLATRSLAHERLQVMSGTEAMAWLSDYVIALCRRDISADSVAKYIHPRVSARCFWQLGKLVARDPERAPADATMAMQMRTIRIADSGDEEVGFRRIILDIHGPRTPEELPDNPDISTRFVQSHSAATLREDLLKMWLEPAAVAKAEFFEFAKKYDGQDHFYRAALNIACGTDPARRDAILADFDKHFPEWNDKVADLVWELRPKSVLPRLEKLLADPKLTAAQKGRIVDILAASESGGQAVLNLLANDDTPAEPKAQAYKALVTNLPTRWAALKTDPAFDRVLAKWMVVGRPDEERIRSCQLIALVGRPSGYLATVARNDQEPLPVRRAAVEAMAAFKSKYVVDTLAGLIGEKRLGLAAVASLGAVQTPEALAVLQRVITDAKAAGEVPSAALAALAASRPGTDWLLKAKEIGDLPEPLVAEAGRFLRNTPFQAQRNKAMLLFPPAGKLDPAKLPTIATLAKARGETGRGQRILAASLKGEAQCLRCHTVRGVGGQIGPDLSMIGVKASRENLLESILLPSKAIADQYLQYQIETKGGQQLLGLIVQQNAEGVVLRDANGKDYTFAKGDIESMTKSPVSIMPADIVKALSEDELLDVVEYLLTLKTPSLTPDWWHIVGPFPNDASDSGLDAVYEPEKRIDLSATYKTPPAYAGGSPRWTKVTRNAEGYVDLMAHYAPKSEQIMSYLYREVESQVDQEATIALGTDDGAKLWLNGELVYETRAHDAAVPEKAKVKVKLKKGANTLLLKIVNGSNPHGFYLTLLGQQEMKSGR
jgi:putative membrane-bound dehydrogenase-like protein